MFVGKLAMFFGRLRVMLRLFVFAHRMMVLSLMVMMGCGVVMTGRGVMMFGRRMFRHLSALRSIGFGRIGAADASPMTEAGHIGSSTYFQVVVKTNGAGSGRSARRASSSSSQSAPGRWSGAMGNKKSRHFLSDKRNPRYDRWSCAIPANTRKSKISVAIRRLAGACTKNKYFFAQGVATTY
jgi:hypothetical protein